MTGTPIDGQVLVLAGVTASVPPSRLPGLVDRVQDELADERDRYAREYECACETDRFEAYFVEEGHWEELGQRCDLDDRETRAVQRTHREQLRWTSRRRGDDSSVEAALEIREPVVIGRRDSGDS